MKSKIIGLTGPTGSGKSTVAKQMQSLGCAIINADELAKNALKKGTICTAQLALEFGADILNKDGEIIRQLLAKRAFSSKENTEKLNNITHPFVFLQSLKLAKKYQQMGYKYIVFDAPLLFESNADIMCNIVITVIAKKDVRVKRIMERDNITKELALLRMAAQQKDDFYKNNSDYIIDGEKDINTQKAELENILLSLAKERQV